MGCISRLSGYIVAHETSLLQSSYDEHIIMNSSYRGGMPQ